MWQYTTGPDVHDELLRVALRSRGRGQGDGTLEDALGSDGVQVEGLRAIVADAGVPGGDQGRGDGGQGGGGEDGGAHFGRSRCVVFVAGKRVRLSWVVLLMC